MTMSKRLAAHRAAAGGADARAAENEIPTPHAGDEDRVTPPEPTSMNKELTMDDAQKAALDAARTEGRDLGFKSANDRMSAVFASEHYEGREALAAKLLGKPGLSAEEILDVLADAPKAAAAAPTQTAEQVAAAAAAAEEAGRKEMQAELAKNQNSGADAGGTPKPDAKKAHGDAWAKHYSEGVN